MSKFGTFFLQLLAFCLYVYVALLFVSFLNSEPSEDLNSGEADAESGNATQEQNDLKVRIDTKPARSINQEEMDAQFLDQVEREMSKEIRQTAEQNLRSRDISDTEISMDSSAFYTFAGTNKLLVLRIAMTVAGQNPPVRQTAVTGFVGEEQRVVTCTTISTQTIPITYGKCGNAIERAFGQSVGVE